jgi:hypothetical protein
MKRIIWMATLALVTAAMMELAGPALPTPSSVQRRVRRRIGLGNCQGSEPAGYLRLLGREFRPAGDRGLGRRPILGRKAKPGFQDVRDDSRRSGRTLLPGQ